MGACTRGPMIGPLAEGGYRATCPGCGEILTAGTTEILSAAITRHVEDSKAQRDPAEVRRRLAAARSRLDEGSDVA